MYPRYFQFPHDYSFENGMIQNSYNNNYNNLNSNSNSNQNYYNSYPNNNNNLNNSYNYNYSNNNIYNNSNGYNYQNNRNNNNLSNRGENGLENGIPNYQRQTNQQISNNLNNNLNYNNANNINDFNNQNSYQNIYPKTYQNIYQNTYQNQNLNQNQNPNEINNNNILNQNLENGKEENGANSNKENGQPEDKKEPKPKSNAELIIDYENNLRKEIQKSTPLISQDYDIKVLLDEYKFNNEYLNSIRNISKKYKYIRKVMRDGNCFYRSFIFRLFEHICIKNDKTLFEKVKQKIMDAKELTEKNGYDWAVVEDFYNLFLKEFNDCFNSLTYENTVRDYLDTLFCEREKGNYLIYFIRFCIAAYLKENKETYQMYIEDSFEDWVRNEVEAIDHEADQIQIMACVNYFDIGVIIEYLNPYKNEVVKFPEDKKDDDIFITVLFTPGHYEILYS